MWAPNWPRHCAVLAGQPATRALTDDMNPTNRLVPVAQGKPATRALRPEVKPGPIRRSGGGGAGQAGDARVATAPINLPALPMAYGAVFERSLSITNFSRGRRRIGAAAKNSPNMWHASRRAGPSMGCADCGRRRRNRRESHIIEIVENCSPAVDLIDHHS
jgi:hypothetical protein